MARARVIEVALTLFAEQGFGSTSVRAVAEASDVKPSAVYRGFGSKDGLLAAATEPLTNVLGAVIAESSGPAEGDRIQVVRAYLLSLLHYRRAARLLLFDESASDTAAAQVLADQQRQLMARLVGRRANLDQQVRARSAMAIAQLGAGELRAVPAHRLRQPLLAAAIDALIGVDGSHRVSRSGEVSLDVRTPPVAGAGGPLLPSGADLVPRTSG